MGYRTRSRRGGRRNRTRKGGFKMPTMAGIQAAITGTTQKTKANAQNVAAAGAHAGVHALSKVTHHAIKVTPGISPEKKMELHQKVADGTVALKDKAVKSAVAAPVGGRRKRRHSKSKSRRGGRKSRRGGRKSRRGGRKSRRSGTKKGMRRKTARKAYRHKRRH